MLKQVADGVHVHESECIQSNAVVVEGGAGVLLVDPGITGAEMAALADDLRAMGEPVAAGFSTHPDWDHVLWHPAFGDAPRYGTARCAAAMRALRSTADWEAQVAEGLPPEWADDIPMELLGLIAGLPPEAEVLPWDGPDIRIIEHQAHASGHAALLIETRGVLIAGDMLSDVLVPMLDLSAANPVEDYLTALELLEDAGERAAVVVPGHGSVGDAGQLRDRIDRDRAYVHALRDGRDPSDPRIGPSAKAGWEWVSGVHAWQRDNLANLT